MNQQICKNCELETSGNYCNSCGQRTSVNKVTFKETFQDFIDVIFSVNAPLFLTLKLLIVNPGELFRNYLSGKRKTYYKPVPFFILTTIVFILIRVIMRYDPTANLVQVGGTSLNENLINQAGVFMTENINNIIFIFVFSFAVFVKLFFYKRYSFAEYIAVSFYVIGFYLVITTVLIFGLKYAKPQLRMLPILLVFFYMIYALTSFFKKISIGVILKILGVYFFSLLFYMMFGYGTSYLIVWLKS